MKPRNSWQNLETASEKPKAEEVLPQTQTSVSMVERSTLKTFTKEKIEKMNALKSVKYAKDKVKEIKEHEAVSEFCGALTFQQQILFGFALTIWIVFNVVNITTMLVQVFAEENVKTVTSEVSLQDEPSLPNIGFMACASTTMRDFAAGRVGNLSATSKIFYEGTIISDNQLECKTFISKSKFNDYIEGTPVRCCGLTLSRQLYQFPEGISSMQQNTLQQFIKLEAKNAEFAGIFLRELKSGRNALDALDPSLDFKVDGKAKFRAVQICDKEKQTTDLMERLGTTYYGLKFTKTKHQEELKWRRPPDTVNVALTKITEQSYVRMHKNITCTNGIARLGKVTWNAAFLAAFQPSTMTVNTKKSIITLQAGLGSAFGLLNTTMLIWTLLFPVVSKKNPGTRRPHQCFGKYCCRSWRWEEE